ncbi:MAG: cell division protein FtsZ [Candidatus Bilamarchaeaceae archaeon]
MFDDIIKSAKQPTSAAESAKEEDFRVRIAAIGVGGAGCNTINRMMTVGIKSARTIAINTDGKHLNMINADKKILIGRSITKGLGAGGDVNIAKKCAEMDRDALRREIGENELVFLCAGMGGGTGGGASPIVANIAKEQGAIVVAIVTYPFALERVRLKKAQESIKELAKECDTVVIIDNNRLSAYAPNLPIDKAFALADSITTRAVKGISDTIAFPSLINVDYADVKTVMERGGISMISLGEASGHDRVEMVAKSTLEHPLLDVNYEDAKGCLLHLEGGPDLTLGDAIKVGELITESFSEEATVKLGARINEGLKGTIRATAIITGVKSPYIFQKGEDLEKRLEGREEEGISYL